MGKTTVKLSRGYLGHDGEFRKVELREPTFDDWLDIGPVEEYQPGDDGALLIVTYRNRYREWAERLCTEPGGDLLGQLDLADGLAVKAAIDDFLRQARRRTSQPMSSSGDGDATPDQSDE